MMIPRCGIFLQAAELATSGAKQQQDCGWSVVCPAEVAVGCRMASTAVWDVVVTCNGRYR